MPFAQLTENILLSNNVPTTHTHRNWIHILQLPTLSKVFPCFSPAFPLVCYVQRFGDLMLSGGHGALQLVKIAANPLLNVRSVGSLVMPIFITLNPLPHSNLLHVIVLTAFDSRPKATSLTSPWIRKSYFCTSPRLQFHKNSMIRNYVKYLETFE